MRLVLASLFICGLATAAAAQDADRYQLESRGDTFVRLDKQTGQISTCVDQSGQMVCRMAADDRDAFEDEVDRLREQVDALENRVTALEGGQSSKALPSEEEFDRTMSYMQRFFRGFLDIVKEFDQDLRGNGETGDVSPNKT
ncbi:MULTISPECIES: hypothetical protein [Mesorhizobium]|uniref:DUF2884 family protein n=1 Tax=Mesorhizobium denitrificans TaxID=2294114 RepID=A0A371XD02_9HYPH|nr:MULTISPECIES: hypothetical protein [Mesorhizobium]RFC67108.1 hypothetical protein DY251_13145 [Mesorhizobium denitrificans]